MHMEIASHRILYEGRQVIFSLGRDVTEEIKMQDEIKQSEGCLTCNSFYKKMTLQNNTTFTECRKKEHPANTKGIGKFSHYSACYRSGRNMQYSICYQTFELTNHDLLRMELNKQTCCITPVENLTGGNIRSQYNG